MASTTEKVAKQADKDIKKWMSKAGWAAKKAKSWNEKAIKASKEKGTIAKIKAKFYKFASKTMMLIVKICRKTLNGIKALWNKAKGIAKKADEVKEEAKKTKKTVKDLEKAIKDAEKQAKERDMAAKAAKVAKLRSQRDQLLAKYKSLAIQHAEYSKELRVVCHQTKGLADEAINEIKGHLKEIENAQRELKAKIKLITKQIRRA